MALVEIQLPFHRSKVWLPIKLLHFIIFNKKRNVQKLTLDLTFVLPQRKKVLPWTDSFYSFPFCPCPWMERKLLRMSLPLIRERGSFMLRAERKAAFVRLLSSPSRHVGHKSDKSSPTTTRRRLFLHVSTAKWSRPSWNIHVCHFTAFVCHDRLHEHTEITDGTCRRRWAPPW